MKQSTFRLEKRGRTGEKKQERIQLH